MRNPLSRVFLTMIVAGVFSAGRGSAAEERPEAAELRVMLNFESASAAEAMPAGWHGGPTGTIFEDRLVVHTGNGAVRIERTPESPKTFSSMSQSMPMDFNGERVELRGYIKTEAVSGFAGLWLREDGNQPNLAFDNMAKRQVRGTTEWTEYSIILPVHRDGRTLLFGFLVEGTGKAWADDLQLLVDGKPIWEAPKAGRKQTVIDQDHTFDAGSQITLTNVTPVQIENLTTLGQIWGFLKYHHPKVTTGQVQWDYELFRIMPAILAANDRSGANATLLQWIDGLGKLDATALPETAGADLHLRPDLHWIEAETRFGPDLSQRLQAIYLNRPKTGDQFYVSLTAGVGNPVFDREPAYSRITTVDAGYQLLGLYRFWNIIRYWFPYRDLLGDDWDAVLTEFIPRIGLAKDPGAYQLELMALIARVQDTHANLWSSLQVRPPVGDSQLPIVVRFIERQAIISQLIPLPEQLPTGLQVGDAIIGIDGVSVDELVKAWAPYYAASNEPTRLRDIARSLTRGPAGNVQLSVQRDGQVVAISTARVPVASLAKRIPRFHDRSGEAFQLLSKEVAYLKLSGVKAEETKSYVERATGTKGLVIDIRNYPSAFTVFSLGNLLVDKPTEFVRFTRGDPANPGAFGFGKPLQLTPQTPHYAGKIMILVDEISQSSAEYTTMAFRVAAQAKVIGSTTAGADGNVSRIPLPGGLHTMISGIGVFYPDKRPTQQIGIIPDVVVKPTLEGIRAGRDEVLEEALRQILGPNSPDEEIRKLAKQPE